MGLAGRERAAAGLTRAAAAAVPSSATARMSGTLIAGAKPESQAAAKIVALAGRTTLRRLPGQMAKSSLRASPWILSPVFPCLAALCSPLPCLITALGFAPLQTVLLSI